MSVSPFDGLAALASAVIHQVHGQDATMVPRRVSPNKGPNAPREDDPSRAPFTARVVRAEAPERFASSDNGLGRTPGMMRVAPTSTRRIVTFPPGLPAEPRKGDLLIFADRPGKTYELGETMPGNLPGITFVFSEKG